MRYLEKLRLAQETNNSWLCIGLDPVPEKLPLPALHQWDEPVLPFNKAIIEATADIACAYKPNLGFYFQWGAAGLVALERTIAYIPKHIPVIMDCKVGDIGHTQMAWARGLFEAWQVDAIVVNPYVGRDAVLSAIGSWPDKGVYVLARTSNNSAQDFQGDFEDEQSLSRQVITAGVKWAQEVQGSIGFVMGSTYPVELELARHFAPSAPFLIPGIGAQGGDLATAVKYGADPTAGPLISSSREILYASAGYDFADRARQAALRLRDQINTARQP